VKLPQEKKTWFRKKKKKKVIYSHWVRSSKLLKSAGDLCLGFSGPWLRAIILENQFGSSTLETELSE